MANANIKAVITAEDRASGVLKGFGDKVDNVNSQILGAAKKASLALVAAAAASTGFALKSAASFEQTRIGLENMLGSVEDARTLLRDINDFAAKTPFEFPELAQATRQLVAFGFSAEDAYDTMKQLGNVSAAVGAPINDLAYLMGTLRAQGRAFTIDIRQFAMRGIPIYEYLGKVMKANGEQLQQLIEDGKVGFPEVQKAFEMLAGEGGKWGNTMERQSKSVNGLFSTLKDTIGMTARELAGITAEGDIKEGSPFARLRDAIMWLTVNLPKFVEMFRQAMAEMTPTLQTWGRNIIEVSQRVGDYLLPKLYALGQVVRDDVIPVLLRLWREVLEPLAPIVGAVMVMNFGAMIDAIRLLVQGLANLINFLLDTKNAVVALSNALGITAVIREYDRVLSVVRAVLFDVFQLLLKVNNTLSNSQAWHIARAFMNPFIDGLKFVIQHINVVLAGIERIKREGGNIGNAAGGFNPLKWDPLGLLGRAHGGAVNAGQPYVVGERSPEMFVPDTAGKVVPSAGGSVSINVNVGMYAGTETEKRRMAEALLTALKDVASSRNMSLQEMMG